MDCGHLLNDRERQGVQRSPNPVAPAATPAAMAAAPATLPLRGRDDERPSTWKRLLPALLLLLVLGGLMIRDVFTEAKDTSVFRLDQPALERLKKDGMSEETVKKLEPLIGREFPTDDAFLAEVAKKIGPEETAKYKDKLLDQARVAAGDNKLLDTEPQIRVQFDDTVQDDMFLVPKQVWISPKDTHPDLELKQQVIVEPTMRFGLVMLDKGSSNSGGEKRLTFKEDGATNNTCIRLDGLTWVFGDQPIRYKDTGKIVGGVEPIGQWHDRNMPLDKDPSGKVPIGRKSVWIKDRPKVSFTQIVEIVPGEQSQLLDTCLVRYVIENQDDKPHQVGLRFLLDTFIGDNDGVPFTIPGDSQLCDTMKEFNDKDKMPAFLQALEKEDLENPGTVARVQLKVGGKIEPPDRVTLGAWPNHKLHNDRCLEQHTLWEVPVLPMKTLTPHDSAVTIYWNEKTLEPGKSREVGFAYGLGQIASGESGGKLAVTVGGDFKEGGEFTVTALVKNPAAGEKVTLSLPAGLELVGPSEEQDVPPLSAGVDSKSSPVTWKVRGAKLGRHTLRAKLNTGAAQSQPVVIKARSTIFK